MNAQDKHDNARDAELVLDHSNFVVKWNGKRSRFGDTMLFRCLAALVADPNEPVENAELVRLIDTGPIRSRDDVRIAIYRTRQKLIAAGMADLAGRIQNVDGAYVIRLEKVTQGATARGQIVMNNNCDDVLTRNKKGPRRES